jgi:Ca2+-transporting ATPase
VVRTIHAVVKGRVRYKVDGLYRSHALKRQLELRLLEIEEIHYASASTWTGNILVCFNSENGTAEIALFITRILSEYRERNAVHEKADLYSDDNDGKIVYFSTSRAENKEPIRRDRQSSQNHPTTSRKTKNIYSSREKLKRFITGDEEQKAESWHLMDVEAVLASLNTSWVSGLSDESVRQNLGKYGPNLLPESVPRSGFSIFFGQLKSLPVALLGAAAVISMFTGGLVDAIIIMSVVVINATIGYVTESQSEKTINSLKSLVRPSAFVLRNGNLKEIKAEEIVPGDILVLRPGCYIVADARLIEVNRLSVDESTLTGESMPVTKTAAPITIKKDIPLADRVNMVYMGTLVTGGQGIAVVVATGRFTEVGQIQTLVGEAKPPETPMEKQLDKLGTQLVMISGAVCGVVFLIGLIRGYGFIQMLKTSISLAVAAVPEGLPTIATTTLTLGIKNMRRHNVLIRHLDAVETLGCIQTLCLDKTGTITMNKMTVVVTYAGMKRMQVSEGRFSCGRENINPFACDELLRLIHISILCNETEVSNQKGEYVLRGSPTENALIHVAISSGIDVVAVRDGYPVLKINYRSENRNYVSTFHTMKPPSVCFEQDNNKEMIGQKSYLVAVKGNPTEVLPMCSWQVKDGIKTPLTDGERLLIDNENERMAGDALRVLGVAYTYSDNGGQEDYHSNKDLIWLGLVGMMDPIRKGVKEAISVFHQAGIETVMITGDQSPTAYAIGKELNLSRGETLEILDSTHLSNLDPDVMTALARKVNVFARVSPANKLTIVQSLQKAQKVVAMTGDGINDGPALKVADIGIAMGHSGTDVAREVAAVVLEDDNLETMIIAVSQGRTIYNNIRKSVHFLLATNMSEIIVMFTAIAGGMGHPLNAMQLLWINLVSDIFPGLALALEPPEPDILKRPPRNPAEPIVRTSDYKRIAFESAMQSVSSLGSYGYGILRYGMGPRAGTLAFMSLTTSELLHALSCRSEKHSIFDRMTGQSPLQPNKYLTIALGGSLTLQAHTVLIPGLRTLLGITPINVVDGFVIGGSAFLSFVVNEITKNRVFSGQPAIDSQKQNVEAGCQKSEGNSFTKT